MTKTDLTIVAYVLDLKISKFNSALAVSLHSTRSGAWGSLHFGRYVVRAKLFCLKCFVPVTGLESSYGKIFIPVTEISGPLHNPVNPGRILMSVHMGNFSPVDRDEIQDAKPKWWNINLYRDLGNRASPTSHMNTLIFLQRKQWRVEISETEPAGLTRLIWRGPESGLIVASFSWTDHNSLLRTRTTTFYIITQVIIAFWLVLAYDLLEDRRTIDVIITKFFPPCFKESLENLDNILRDWA